MKTVSLVSGGKDSCYNMVVCEQYGHEIVALANLLPAAAETDDLDSYMYQTVGHQVIQAYAQCCGLPLFRRRIRGSSQQQQLVYEDTEGDEVEDLFCLLAFIKERLPEVQAVASGAIASDYQRTRVERVCARLGLVSLAYLWQQPQAPLLQRMIDSGIDAILVKIAAAGLTPGHHLGAPLASLPQQLAKLRRIYGCNVCGEGGEYESLTLDCPLFRRGRIVLDSWQAVTVSEDSLAPVALLHPTAFHFEPKQPAAATAAAAAEPLGEQQAEGRGVPFGGEVIEVPQDYVPQQSPAPAPVATAEGAGAGPAVNVWATTGSEYVTLVAEVPCQGGPAAAATAAGTAATLAGTLRQLGAAMAVPGLGLGWRSALFVHLYVPSMAHFAAANEAYSAFFPAINPPARATVEIGANSELALVVEVLLARRPQGLRVLHVQSISEWAPSCIGPYAQALTHGGLVLMAGQIPLDPPTMAMVGGGLDAQCARALRSCQAVAVAQKTDLPNSTLWCTVYCSSAAGAAGTQCTGRHLDAFLAGAPLDGAAAGSSGAEGGVEPGESGWESDTESGGPLGDRDEEGDLDLDEYLVPPPMRRHWRPLLTYALMPELPRGAMVEIQPVACVVDEAIDASSSSSSCSDDEVAGPTSSGGGGAAGQGSMPGWIGQLQQREHAQRLQGCSLLAARPAEGASEEAAAAAAAVGALHLGDTAQAGLELRCCELASRGRLCRAQVTLTPAAEQPAAQGSAAVAAAAPAWQDAVGEALLGALRHAELEPSDIAALKVYCPGKAAVQAGLGLRASLQGQLGGGVQAAVVPVAAVGPGPALAATLLVELLAVRRQY